MGFGARSMHVEPQPREDDGVRGHGRRLEVERPEAHGFRIRVRVRVRARARVTHLKRTGLMSCGCVFSRSA